ncbi:MAG: primosomal protein N' [Pseudomonadota bacterium]
MSVLRLALPTPLRRLFDYLPPEGLSAHSMRPGQRLRVPFGKREMVGILVEVSRETQLSPAQLKHAIEVLDAEPLPNPALIKLCLWAADYYLHPTGEVIASAFPSALRRGTELPEPGESGWRLTSRAQGLPDGALSRSPRQAQAIELLGDGKAHTARELRDAGIKNDVMRRLTERGWVVPCRVESTPDALAATSGHELNAAQSAAVMAINDTLGEFHAHLLEGVTGSGKTEVYLGAIAACLGRGQQALVLIPEIGLTPQTLSRFEARFKATVCCFHSGLTDRQRLDSWAQAQCGAAAIVIGTRSAVFTAMPRLGLIVVDEEHDASYKQQDGFRYSARDVAVKRAQLERCPVVLGSATPSLESLHNAVRQRYRHHRLEERAGKAVLPELQVIDLRRKPLYGGLSEPLLQRARDTLSTGSQVLLFLNRRGYAPALRCHDCGWIANCSSCDARLTVHRARGQLRCHHCGATEQLPRSCPDCHSDALMTQGLGTEQAEDAIRAKLPEWRTLRVDSDSTRSREALDKILHEVSSGEPCILLGTQMLAKGHHFPGVSLVGIIDADAMLFSGDFRGEERMAQMLTQVAGRAGRAGQPGYVLLQSHHPDHPALQAMLQTSYHRRALDLLDERGERQLPPTGQLALLRADCSDAAAGEAFLTSLRAHLMPTLPAGVQLVGPLPAPMHRRAGKFRWHLLLQGGHRSAVRTASALAVSKAESLRAPGDCKWSVDVDPTEPL